MKFKRHRKDFQASLTRRSSLADKRAITIKVVHLSGYASNKVARIYEPIVNFE